MSPSIWQVLIVLVIVLVLFGPKRIPGLGKSLGEAIRGFKKGISEDETIDVTETSAKSEQLKDNEEKASSTAQTEKEKDKV